MNDHLPQKLKDLADWVSVVMGTILVIVTFMIFVDLNMIPIAIFACGFEIIGMMLFRLLLHGLAEFLSDMRAIRRAICKDAPEQEQTSSDATPPAEV